MTRLTPFNRTDKIEALLDLVRRLAPQNIDSNLGCLSELVSDDLDTQDEFLGSVDKPLEIRTDSSNREYLICDYNRDGDSYRSPYTNSYSPELSDGTLPSPQLRQLETGMNDALETYRDMYFEGGLSSVYLWDLDGSANFAGVVLIKKTVDDGSWDSVHVFEVSTHGREANYKLTTTVILSLKNDEKESKTNLSGSLTRQCETNANVPAPSAHITNIGRLIEEHERGIRNSLAEVYLGKTKDILNEIRIINGQGEEFRKRSLQQELLGKLKSK
ncbi:subunits of heterodimeric actin filament capping protein Capz [Wallemia mellicola]|nr:subunits of heterodimeric actin filament capping protein Capz [Wallemia mellicola]